MQPRDQSNTDGRIAYHRNRAKLFTRQAEAIEGHVERLVDLANGRRDQAERDQRIAEHFEQRRK